MDLMGATAEIHFGHWLHLGTVALHCQIIPNVPQKPPASTHFAQGKVCEGHQSGEENLPGGRRTASFSLGPLFSLLLNLSNKCLCSKVKRAEEKHIMNLRYI